MQYHSNFSIQSTKKDTVDPGCFCDSAAEKLKIWKESDRFIDNKFREAKQETEMIKLYKQNHIPPIPFSIDTLYFPGDFLNLIGFLSETNKLRFFFLKNCLRLEDMFPHHPSMVF